MKNLIFLLFTISLFAVSCTSELPEPTPQVVTSVDDVRYLNLNSKYSIPDAVYNEFMNSITFENGHFTGCYYKAVDELLDEKTSVEFWKNFGINISRNIDNEIQPRKVIDGTDYQDKKNYPGGGCEPMSGWVCTT